MLHLHRGPALSPINSHGNELIKNKKLMNRRGVMSRAKSQIKKILSDPGKADPAAKQDIDKLINGQMALYSKVESLETGVNSNCREGNIDYSCLPKFPMEKLTSIFKFNKELKTDANLVTVFVSISCLFTHSFIAITSIVSVLKVLKFFRFPDLLVSCEFGMLLKFRICKYKSLLHQNSEDCSLLLKLQDSA
ncbi:hypothetical protein QAD02_014112 [Eretmocerus hayati]|uniref:Uncharacterized protein n=1 Tax=Eretmocerus hayati TaxID=131215 RepID=A0ACC2P408_9HYME|nr:hypothetical protein QAD02_014112 [Eretmocerus hayati]